MPDRREKDCGGIAVKLDPRLRDIVPGYLEHRARDVEALAAALERRDWDAMKLVGHRIKGSGASYGFEELSAAGAAVEAAAGSRDPQTCSRAVEGLADALARIVPVYD